MHVPKSAGRSVSEALESALPHGSISPKRQDTTLLCGFSDFGALGEHIRSQLVIDPEEISELSDYRVVSGHFSLSTLLAVTGASSVATVLREPRARLLSHYAYWRYSSGLRAIWKGYPPLDHALRPLGDFLAEPRIAQATDNLVCRMLLPEDPRIPADGFILPEDVEGVAASALRVLGSFGFVGVVECAEAMWRGLSRFFDVSLAPRHTNRTADEGAASDVAATDLRISPATLDLIELRTAADSVVYRRVLERIDPEENGAGRVSTAAYASELVMLGNVAGPSAAAAREGARVIAELQGRLEEAGARGDRAAWLEEELVRTQTELQRHRDWLEQVRRSSSWRLTAPVRGAAHTLRSIRAARRTAGSAHEHRHRHDQG